MPSETVLITGASSGLGEDFARLFAADGSNLVLVARSTEKLEALASQLRQQHPIQVTVLPLDLSTPSASETLLAQLRERSLAVDVLVNNAGFGETGLVSEIPLDRQLQMIQLNVTTLFHLTRLLLPDMLARGCGGILNVASTAAFQPGPRMALYYATKAFVLSFTEALSHELKSTPVTVTCLCPGPTATHFAAAAHAQSSKLFTLGMLPSRTVAVQGYRAFRNRRPLIVTGWRNKLLAFSIRLFPRWVPLRVTSWLNRPH